MYLLFFFSKTKIDTRYSYTLIIHTYHTHLSYTLIIHTYRTHSLSPPSSSSSAGHHTSHSYLLHCTRASQMSDRFFSENFEKRSSSLVLHSCTTAGATRQTAPYLIITILYYFSSLRSCSARREIQYYYDYDSNSSTTCMIEFEFGSRVRGDVLALLLRPLPHIG